MKINSLAKLLILAIPLGIGISFLILGFDIMLALALEYVLGRPSWAAEVLFMCLAITEWFLIVGLGFSFLQAQTVTSKDILTLKTLSKMEYHQHLLLGLSLMIAGILFWFLLLAFYQDVFALL